MDVLGRIGKMSDRIILSKWANIFGICTSFGFLIFEALSSHKWYFLLIWSLLTIWWVWLVGRDIKEGKWRSSK